MCLCLYNNNSTIINIRAFGGAHIDSLQKCPSKNMYRTYLIYMHMGVCTTSQKFGHYLSFL